VSDPPVGAVHPRLTQVVIDAVDPRRSAEFWRQVLGLTYRTGHEPPPPGAADPRGGTWLNLLGPAGEPCLAFEHAPVPARPTWPAAGVAQQLHLDLTVTSRGELDAVHALVLRLGGVLLDDRAEHDEEPLRVYADLDGHPFCVFVLAAASDDG
jgi:hypothetical protein